MIELKKLKLYGMIEYLTQNQDETLLNHVSQMTYYESVSKLNKKSQRLKSQASLIHTKSLENIDWSLNKIEHLIPNLQKLSWVYKSNICISGPTGTGKTYLANAIGITLCQNGISVKYLTCKTLFSTDIKTLEKISVVIIDDFGISTIDDNKLNYLFNLLDYSSKSFIIISQLHPNKWQQYLGLSIITDAILDRFLSKAISIELSCQSLRWQN